MLRCSIAPKSWLERRCCPKLALAPGQAGFPRPKRWRGCRICQGSILSGASTGRRHEAVAPSRLPLRIEVLAPWTACGTCAPSTFACACTSDTLPISSADAGLACLPSGLARVWDSSGKKLLGSRRPTMRSISRPSGATNVVGTTSMGTLRVRPSALSLDVDEAQRCFVPHRATIFRQHVAAIELTAVAASRRPSSFHGRQANGRAMHECGSLPRFASTLHRYDRQLPRQTLDRTASPDPPASWDRRLCRAQVAWPASLS